MNIHFWNIFHDGDIAAVTGIVPGDIEFFIEAEYLREQFSDPGIGFKLQITACSMMSFKSFRTNQTVSGINALKGCDLEILSAKMDDKDLIVITTSGEIRLRYESEKITLDTGRQLQISDMATASDKALAEHRKSTS